ncbi:MAG TPA: MliC family protein [Candidatus Paceibacterota bacterium]|nr:MliC family protein [Candidatus Paceibacterota bacterium]
MHDRPHPFRTFAILSAALIAAAVLAYVAHAYLAIPRATPAPADTHVLETPATTLPDDGLIAPLATVEYGCAEGRAFTARVEVRPESPGNAEVVLEDGSTLLLAQTRSASGARYANSDESFVFWTKGNTAFIEKDGQMAYADCVAQGTE